MFSPSGPKLVWAPSAAPFPASRRHSIPQDPSFPAWNAAHWGASPKGLRLLLKNRNGVQPGPRAGGHCWARVVGGCVCLCVHVSPRGRSPYLCPFSTRHCSSFTILGWGVSLVTAMTPGRGYTWRGNTSPGAPAPAGQTAGHSHIQTFGLSLLSLTSPTFNPAS